MARPEPCAKPAERNDLRRMPVVICRGNYLNDGMAAEGVRFHKMVPLSVRESFLKNAALCFLTTLLDEADRPLSRAAV